MPQPIEVMTENEIEVALTMEELERLLHEVNNRACEYSIIGSTTKSPWESIRMKLLNAIRSC